jgi:hypothetical protein
MAQGANVGALGAANIEVHQLPVVRIPADRRGHNKEKVDSRQSTLYGRQGEHPHARADLITPLDGMDSL